MKIYILLCIVFISASTFAQNKAPYKFYTAKGKETSYKKLINIATDVDVVLFGEQHNDALVHWLELELAKDVSKEKPVTLGAEMVEADNQQALLGYLLEQVDQKALDTLARLWPNYKTDYKPLVDFAREKKIPFIATNIPRRYASMVYKGGFEALDTLADNEKKWIAPLPVDYDAELPGYKAMLKMGGGMHGGENLPKAQAVKDATMAYFITQNLNEGGVFIHYNGSYHSDYFEGINWYLKKYKPGIKIITVATVSQADINSLEKEHFGKADFILVIDADMTKTY